jgi:hypothetical protein
MRFSAPSLNRQLDLKVPLTRAVEEEVEKLTVESNELSIKSASPDEEVSASQAGDFRSRHFAASSRSRAASLEKVARRQRANSMRWSLAESSAGPRDNPRQALMALEFSGAAATAMVMREILRDMRWRCVPEQYLGSAGGFIFIFFLFRARLHPPGCGQSSSGGRRAV